MRDQNPALRRLCRCPSVKHDSPHRRHGDLLNGIVWILDAVTGFVRVIDFEVQDAVDIQHHVIYIDDISTNVDFIGLLRSHLGSCCENNGIRSLAVSVYLP